ncbi:MAG: hypothetical protein EWM72_01463 [Nitrospira sp.]|nr:MAG: hypothetical protein EWM72_01463 [Nitrospira sp.]
MARAAALFGVDKADLVLEVESHDTAEQDRLIAARIGSDRFLLVTSALHMPRSVALFEKQELSPIPAPTDYLAHQGGEVHPGRHWPTAENLFLTQVAVHEYLAMIWAAMRGEI